MADAVVDVIAADDNDDLASASVLCTGDGGTVIEADMTGATGAGIVNVAEVVALLLSSVLWMAFLVLVVVIIWSVALLLASAEELDGTISGNSLTDSNGGTRSLIDVVVEIGAVVAVIVVVEDTSLC